MPGIGYELASATDLRRALDALGYQFVFNAIADAVDWHPERSFGISVERLISGLTGVERSSDPALSPTRSPVEPKDGDTKWEDDIYWRFDSRRARDGAWVAVPKDKEPTRSPVVEPGSAAADSNREPVAWIKAWVDNGGVVRRVLDFMRDVPAWLEDVEVTFTALYASPAPVPSGDVAGLEPGDLEWLRGAVSKFRLSLNPGDEQDRYNARIDRILSALSPARGGKGAGVRKRVMAALDLMTQPGVRTIDEIVDAVLAAFQSQQEGS